MPDRAVVDDAYWTDPLPTPGLPRCPLCDAEMMPNIGGTWTCHKDHTPQPRALIALSEDRQWLVVNERWPHGTFFMIYRWDVQPNMVEPWRWVDKEDDTGQDAHQVLADFLRERGA